MRGVYKSERSGKWCAQITFQGKTRYLGSFDSLTEAFQARKKGEELFDEFLARYDLEHPENRKQPIGQEEKTNDLFTCLKVKHILRYVCA